jgi:Right handed beta helix region
MRRIILLALTVGLLFPLLASAPAHAQATRTWVSGVGDDANPCSRTAPCKTFAGAISKTSAAGEINCLDPGGFGGITITKSITLNCSATLGSILVSGTPGVTINALTTDRVILRGLQIQGINSGTIGVRILAAAVVSIEDSVITQFAQQGIVDGRTGGGTKLMIRNTVVSHNTAAGIALAAAATNNVEIENSSLINNLFGLAAGSGSNVVVKRTVLSNNGTGVEADNGANVTIDDSAISGNGTGVQATSGNIRLSNSDINFNTINGMTGSPVSYGNNRVSGNAGTTATTAAGTPTSDLGQQ